MGHLANLILVLLAAAAVDELGALGAPLPWAVPFAIVAPYLLVPLVRRSIARRDSAAANRGVRVLRRAPVLVQVACDWALGWGLAVSAWRGPSELPPGWPTGWELARFAPFVLSTLVVLDATARVYVDRAAGRRWMRFQARTFLGAAIPILVFVFVDSALAIREDLAWWIHGVELWSSVHAFVLLAFLVVALPGLLQLAWGAEPMPYGALRDCVHRVMIGARFRCHEILLWSTGRSMANAMIVGLLPSTRRVFFSDSLLASLTLTELSAVTAHEIGHAKRGHIGWFLMLALGAFGVMGAAAQWWEPAWPVPFEAGVIVVLAVGGLGFGWLSRRFELEADLYATELTGDPTAIGRALMRLGGRLRDVAGWRHFAPSARDAFLQRAQADPAFLASFRRRMSVARIAIAVFFVLGFGGSFVAKVQTFDVDRYRVAVWLGRYDSAVRSSADLELSAGERAALQRAAHRLGNGRGLTRADRASRVRGYATDALADLEDGLQGRRGGDVILPVALLDLAWTAGDETAAQWFAAADAARDDPSALSELPEAWRSIAPLLAARYVAATTP